ncbi:hypothetical protein BC628DRAFT_1045943 [Trametes gibbosa]|nr:hypothetical protein BC628DRAFT_1045943 [Trametes gibbosa]
MSQELLPMNIITARPTLEDHQQDVLDAAPANKPNALVRFFGGGMANPPEYTRLPVEDDVEKGLLSPGSASGPSTPAPPVPAPAALLQSLSSEGGTPVTGRLAFNERVYATVWYIRMLLYFALVGAGSTVFSSLFLLSLAWLTGLTAVEATKRLSAETRFLACLVGGALAGAVAGLGAFIAMCVRAVRVARRDALVREGRIPPPPPYRGIGTTRGWLDADDDTELSTLIFVAPLFGVFGLALGLAVVPSLAAAAAEAGYNGLLAVGVGFWGLGVLCAPGIVGMVIRTLSDCSPCEGFFGAYCFCCSSY